ncbi:hypothetical protein ACX40Y_01570 [Sphingomonas sp. RS6]
MRKALILPVAALALAGLSACGNKANNEAAEANEAMAGDSNTMGDAVADVNAAENAAFDAAENAYADVATGNELGNEIVD